MACGPVREAVGVCQDEPSHGAAVDDPPWLGFGRADVSADISVSLSLDRRHAEYIRQQLTCGGLRLGVHTADRDLETPIVPGLEAPGGARRSGSGGCARGRRYSGGAGRGVPGRGMEFLDGAACEGAAKC